MKSRDLSDLFKVGETVLVEYTGTSRPELFLYHLVTSSGLPVVIDDVLDTYYEFYTRLKVSGVDVTPLEDVRVIKMGGTRDVGKVLGRLNISKYIISEKEYMAIIKQIGEYPFLNPVLGVHKLVLLGNILENMNIVKMVSNYVGNKERVAFYFINKNVILKHSPPLLDLLEEVATSVIEVTDSGIIVKKSIKNGAGGKIISLFLNQDSR
ncbi:hypothetical protein PNA2_0768 [Pyrococcus sp. NA2]|uniref:DUF257 family protein n=1 Tax=Pyrococcus sp. (strain NA2) TaxID=342949 RepID=UPI000209AE80|nr:DUF257 family protein [Pyrococcus sp. NA2]AEC51683.1 hypothetical protein PNA2_0768 [Pyrococcus sp. NA2]